MRIYKENPSPPAHARFVMGIESNRQLVSSPVSMFVTEQFETLASLPFLIWKFSGGGFQKLLVIGDRLPALMKVVVGGCPEKIGGGNFGKIF